MQTHLENSLDATVRELWGVLYARKRGYDGVPATRYRGVRMLKLADDLAAYEALLWDVRPELVIEVGSLDGGSALWFHDRLALLQASGLIERFAVVSIDREANPDRARIRTQTPGVDGGLRFIEGDALAPAVLDEVGALRSRYTTCMVVEDSRHDEATTLGALRAYGDLVSPGSFYVVEDGVVDIPELCAEIAPVRAARGQGSWPTGVRRAIDTWLTERDDFEMDRSREPIVTAIPWGFLRRSA